MAKPVVARQLEVEDVVDMSVEELRQYLDSLGLRTRDLKGLYKAQLQKLLLKSRTSPTPYVVCLPKEKLE